MIPPEEARLLAAMICNGDAREECDSLEIGDLQGYPHRVVLGAIRDVQASGEPMSIVAVCDAIERLAAERENATAEHVSLAFVADLVAGQRSYGAEIALLREDLRWVKTSPERKAWLRVRSPFRRLADRPGPA